MPGGRAGPGPRLTVLHRPPSHHAGADAPRGEGKRRELRYNILGLFFLPFALSVSAHLLLPGGLELILSPFKAPLRL